MFLGGLLDGECQAFLNAAVERYPGPPCIFKHRMGGTLA